MSACSPFLFLIVCKRASPGEPAPSNGARRNEFYRSWPRYLRSDVVHVNENVAKSNVPRGWAMWGAFRLPIELGADPTHRRDLTWHDFNALHAVLHRAGFYFRHLQREAREDRFRVHKWRLPKSGKRSMDRVRLDGDCLLFFPLRRRKREILTALFRMDRTLFRILREATVIFETHIYRRQNICGNSLTQLCADRRNK